MSRHLRIYLPQASFTQLLSISDFAGNLSESEKLAPSQAWDADFCRFIGSESDKLPWTQLRMAQFTLGREINTLCSCDPVMVKVTHRGAYMLGQSPLVFSQNDAIRLVAQINEKLMGEGEHMYLVDKYAWLYASDKTLSQQGPDVDDLVGKDLYQHPYQGTDAEHWRSLGNEIQMLAKQMVDFGELQQSTPDLLLNVHFHGGVTQENQDEIAFVKNDKLTIYSDNDMISSYAGVTMLSSQPLAQLNQATQLPDQLAIVAMDSERESYPEIIEFWLAQIASGDWRSASLICQDQQINWQQKSSWFKRLIGR